MIVFIITLLFLCVIALLVSKLAKTSSFLIIDSDFNKLKNQYLVVYYLATFADWLQGPFVYKLYSDYGYDDDTIAVLYIVGFVSSSLFGMVVGHIADKYGRKILCASFGIMYTICCLSKMSTQFHILCLGRVFGGVSTSILFSTFEAWYVNEHLNHYQHPPEWLNETFSKAAFYTGLLAIVAGIVSQFLVDTLLLGSISPFLLAVPILITSTYMVLTTWEEHLPAQLKSNQNVLIFSALKLIFCEETVLLALCFIQSFYESVMYIFIFSWTPTLSIIHPPLGIVFSIFMLAFMIGSKIYSILVSKRFHPHRILTVTCAIGLLSHSITACLTSALFFTTIENNIIYIYCCFFSFLLYEVSVGLYFPATSYLRGRVIPEKFRASVTNWFRVPMNLFTCLVLILKQKSSKVIFDMSTETTLSETVDFKFSVIFIICSILLVVTTVITICFSKAFLSHIKKESNQSPYINL